MKIMSLKLWFEKLRLAFLRFPFTIAYLFGLAYLLFSNINNWLPDIQPHTWTLFGLGIPMSIAITLYAEQFLNKFSRLAFQLLGLLLLYAFCDFLPDKLIPVYNYQVVSLGLVFLLSASFVSYFKPDNDVQFWEFCKSTIIQLIIAFVFSQVLMLGLSLAVISLKELFDVDIQKNVYANLAVICYVIFGPIYFLMNIPDEIDKQKDIAVFYTFLKILGLYILLPILALYSLILYVYFGQILIKWELPNGWLSTLVTVLSFGGFLTMMILYPLHSEGKPKLVKWFSRYFPLILFPLLVLMFVGIYRRLSDYGITINRSYILLLNLWLFGICHYLFYSKAKHLKWIVISFTAILLLATVGPWSVPTVTKRILTNNLEELFETSEMLENGKLLVDPNQQIDSLTSSKIVETIRYLNYNYGNAPISKFFLYSLEQKSLNQIFAALHLNIPADTTKTTYIYANIKPDYMVEIGRYQYMFDCNFNSGNNLISKNDRFVFTLKGDIVILHDSKNSKYDLAISLKPWLEKIELLTKEHKNNDLSVQDMTVVGNGIRFVVKNLSANYNAATSEYVIENLDVNVFLKSKVVFRR